MTPEIAQVIDELWEEVYLHSRIAGLPERPSGAVADSI